MGDKERMTELQEGINALQNLQISYLTAKLEERKRLAGCIISTLQERIVKNQDLIENPTRRVKFCRSLEIWENIARKIDEKLAK